MHDKSITLSTIQSLKDLREITRNKLNELDKSIKYHEGLLSNDAAVLPTEHIKENKISAAAVSPALMGNIKTQLMAIFNEASKPLKMTDLQASYTERTGKEFNIREYVRSLNKQKVVRIMKINGSNRNAYWVLKDWVDNGQLRDEYKWDGFDNLYSPEDIEFV